MGNHPRRSTPQVPIPQSEKNPIFKSELETRIRSNGNVQHTILCWEDTVDGPQIVGVREKWTRQERLGKGSFGTVFKETCRRTADGSSPNIRAVKEIKCRKRSKTNPYRELEAITKFSHPEYRDFFVYCHGWWQTTEALHIAMEYLPLGDLHSYIKQGLPEEEVKHITQQLLVGLDHMHRNRFAHRDLKPKNILVADIGPHWWVKISDFGITKRFSGNSILPGDVRRQGTVGFMAPELHGMIQAASDPYLCDIWSLGAVVFQIYTGRLFMKDSATLKLLVNGQIPFPEDELMQRDVSLAGIDFVTKLLSLQPTDRPMASDAMRHAWFTSPVANDCYNNMNLGQTTSIHNPSLLPRTPMAPQVQQPYHLQDPFVQSSHNTPLRNFQASYAQPTFPLPDQQRPINNPTNYQDLPAYPAPAPPQDFSPQTNATDQEEEDEEDAISSSEATTMYSSTTSSDDDSDDPVLSTPSTSHHHLSPVAVAATATKPLPAIPLPRTDPSCTFCTKTYPLSDLSSGRIASYHPNCPRSPYKSYICSPCATARVLRRVVQLHDQQQQQQQSLTTTPLSLAVLLTCELCGGGLIFSGRWGFEADEEEDDEGRGRRTGRCQYTHPAFVVTDDEEKYGVEGGGMRSSALRVPSWFRTCLEPPVQFGCAAVGIGGLLRAEGRRVRGGGGRDGDETCATCGGRSSYSGCEPGVVGGYCRVEDWVEHWRTALGMRMPEGDERKNDTPIVVTVRGKEARDGNRKKSGSSGRRDSGSSASSSGKMQGGGAKNGGVRYEKHRRKKRTSFLATIFSY